MCAAVTMVCVPGVGLWPQLFDAVPFGRSAAQTKHSPVHIERAVRPGYDGIPAVDDFEDQVRFVADRVRAVAPAVVVGVSGGATIALACATRSVDGLVAAVSHEPLVGALAPELNDRVVAAGQALAGTADGDDAGAFLRGLYGHSSWDAIPEAGRTWTDRHVPTVCAEVAQFAAYQPSTDELAALTVPHLTTVGSRSAPVRHRIAQLLASLGSETATVEASGHLVLVDQPARFGSLVAAFVDRVMD